MGWQWKQWETIFWGSRITANGDCSHEIKRHLLLRRKAMTNLDSILKSRDIPSPTKVHLGKAMVFPVVMCGYESWTIKKAGCRRINAFELWCWRRLSRVPWTARWSNQSILKEISPEYSLEGLMVKLKLQYFGHLMLRTDSLEKTLMLGTLEDRRRRGWQRIRWLDGITDSIDVSLSKLRELVMGRGSLACCGPWGRKELDTAERLNGLRASCKTGVSPLKLLSIESAMPSNHLILCRPLLLLPSVFPSIKSLFKWVSSSNPVAKELELQL